jgi:hypothetical protein
MRQSENGETWEGISTDGFKGAAIDAVKKFEKERGVPDEPVTMKVVEMSVTVHNPIHDYRILLTPSG